MDAPTLFAVESFTHRNATLTWVDASGAAFYRIYVGTTSVFADAEIFCTILPGIQRVMVTGLLQDTVYYFWIVAEDASGILSIETITTCTTDEYDGEDFAITVVQKALYDWAVDNFGDYSVIWEKGKGPRPEKPFVSLNISGAPQFGGEDHVREGDQLCGNRMFMISVNIYDTTEAMQKAIDLRTTLQRPDVVDSLQESGIGIGEINPVTDISELLDASNWEPRAHFDFGVIVASTKDFDAGQISTVELTNTIGG
jgi:hypothetical protein